jgi:hypothetical protein
MDLLRKIVPFSLLLLSILILILYYITYFSNASAASPSFTRQEIKDNYHDFLAYDNSRYIRANSNCSLIYPPTDIKSVSYISNGKILNATVWMIPPPGIAARDVISPRNLTNFAQLKHIVYSMYIDVDSIYESGVDYIVNLFWNNTAKVWTKEIIESSPPDAKFLLSKSDLNNVGKGYVNLSFDLGIANYPTQYKLFFATRDTAACDLVDVTNYVSVPPPEFTISASPNYLELRRGEEKNVQFQISSKTGLNANVSIFHNVSMSDISIDPTPSQIVISPYSTGASNLKIGVSDSARIQSYLIPIAMNISFPKSVDLTLGGKISFDNEKSTILHKEYVYSVKVLPPLTPEQHLSNFVNSWITPITGLWTFLAGVAAVIGPLAIRMYSNRQKRRKEIR